ncbi:MAG: hypothetical protein ACRDTV_16715 [Mycobacterium sp.]
MTDMEAPQADVGDEDHSAAAVRTRWLAAAAVVAVLAGAGGYAGWRHFERHQTEVAAQQALAAAEKYATALTNFDSKSMNHNITEILNGSTGEFKDRFGKTHGPLWLVLLDHQAVARGHIVESAVKSASPNEVVVLLMINQSISNLDGPVPEIDRSRIKMTMDKIDGQWLVSKVELR